MGNMEMDNALQCMHYDKNVEIPLKNGLYVAANIFRPKTDEKVPVLMTISAYGKDLHMKDGFPEVYAGMLKKLPWLKEESTLSFFTWESHDPEFWTKQGYACVRVDSPGVGKSPGKVDVWSDGEAEAMYQVIEWLADMPWCNGNIGLMGISYLAVTQWLVAAKKPPHLKCIVPWEGFNDQYREIARNGGILGFFPRLWFDAQVMRLQHKNPKNTLVDLDDPHMPIGGKGVLSAKNLLENRVDYVNEIKKREMHDGWYASRTAELEKIEIPLLSAANWGGLGLHGRGNFEGFTRTASKEKWLEVHGKDHVLPFYEKENQLLQKEFFDHYLKGVDNGWEKTPPVILNIRHVDDTFTRRYENEWPLQRTEWTKMYLNCENMGLEPASPEKEASANYRGFGKGITFRSAPMERQTEITGPMAAKLYVSSSTEDMDLFLTLRAFSPQGEEVTFVGSIDHKVPLSQGWLRVSHRKLDMEKSLPYRPWHSHDELQKILPGQEYEVLVEVWPTCVVLPAGYYLELLIEGKDFVRQEQELGETEKRKVERYSKTMSDPQLLNMLYRGSGTVLHNDPDDRPAAVFDGVCTVYTGGERDSYLLLPVIPQKN